MKRISLFFVILALLFTVGCATNNASHSSNGEKASDEAVTEVLNLSDEELAKAVAQKLNVPQREGITYKISEKHFWEAADIYFKNITFYENGQMLAGADVNPKNGELLKNIYKYAVGQNESMADKITRELEEEYNKDSMLEEYQSTVGMIELSEKYTEKWKQIADEYYNKLLEIDNIEPMNEYYYTADEMHTFVTNMKTNWEEYNKIQCENYAKAIRAAYNGGTLAGPVAANYALERQKEWAIQLINLYAHF